MIAYRQRGLVTLYAFVVNGLAVGALLLWREAVLLFPFIDLRPSVNFSLYGMAVFVGMTASSTYMRRFAHSLHALSVSDAAAMAFRQVLLVAGCLFAAVFATKDKEISRLFLGCYLVILSVGLTLAHRRLPRWLARVMFSRNARLRTVFIGTEASLRDVDEWVRDRSHLGIEPVGFVPISEEITSEKHFAKKLGKIEDLAHILATFQVGQVILLEWLGDPAKMEAIADVCESEGCRFLIHNNYNALSARQLIPVQEGNRQFFAIQDEPLEDPVNRALKRTLDIMISLPVVVFILPPVFLLVWLMQRLQSPGPLLFVRYRGGQNRTQFRMLKFRSMYPADPDPLKEARQATANDGRVFPFGRLMRKTSLDEFPQFLNVLWGDMSVVGPRPHPVKMDEQFSQLARAYRIRSLVKPGITGLAQVRGFRGEITEPEKLEKRVYWDLFYVTNWSIWMDVQIIFMTAWQVLFPPKTAY